jgi:hypothetical protein
MGIKIAKLLVIMIAIHLFKSCNMSDPVDYAADVKPILNKHCLACHGGVQKKGGWSLLFKEEAFGLAESGKPAIIPGDAKNSEMIKRLHDTNPEERMPYQKDPLTEKEIKILTDWINQGAVWTDHWAYVPVKKPAQTSNSENAVDDYIAKTLKDNGLSFNNKADKITLGRRMSLDIIGIPVQRGENLLPDQWADTLLLSPLYGEKWASMWLDLARYADTKGYERDDNREIWRYRDWLIKAFNEDMPYNRFLTAQLAGDLKDNPTEEDFIATAFHRNTMTNDEGGTDNEEYRTAAVTDRVNTTWEATMGTTFACVQCHSHPYDAFRHEDYYKFMAYFNNTRDEDTYHDYPVIRHLNDSLKQRLSVLEKYVESVDPSRKKEIITFVKTLQPSVNSIRSGKFVNAELNDTKFLAMRQNSQAVLPKIRLSGVNTLIVQARTRVKNGVWTIRKGDKDGKILAKVTFKTPEEDFWKWKNYIIPLDTAEGVHNLHFSWYSSELKDLNTEGLYFNWFHFTKEFPGKSRPDYVENRKLFEDLINVNTPVTPIMMDNPEHMYRSTHVFERGSWLSKGPEVRPGLPAIFKQSEKYDGTRLGLAKWMTSPENPLVARTIVNRVWEQIFGTGLVETLEDLGSQAPPSPHIPLLDYLSYQLIHEYQWSIKKLIKTIVTSKTYQQSSLVSDAKKEKDPFNKLFSRGPRIRLTGEQLRDQALYITGMLSYKMYGPPVMPFQPEGIWNAPYNGSKWTISEGEDRYRRAIYTFWKRTSPYPSMMTFDGATRDVCVARRIRTNTPLQALVTMNDSVYLDLSGKFASLVIKEKSSEDEQIKFAYKRATGKIIQPEQLEILKSLYVRSKEQYSKNLNLTNSFITIEKNKRPEYAAMAIVCNAILNLDEVIVKT